VLHNIKPVLNLHWLTLKNKKSSDYERVAVFATSALVDLDDFVVLASLGFAGFAHDGDFIAIVVQDLARLAGGQQLLAFVGKAFGFVVR
jgi:hypothetical protein